MPQENILQQHLPYAGAGMERNVVGPRVRQARRKARPPITQGELAARLQLMGFSTSQAMISKIESRARPVMDTEVVALAKALGVSVAWLLGKDRDEMEARKGS